MILPNHLNYFTNGKSLYNGKRRFSLSHFLVGAVEVVWRLLRERFFGCVLVAHLFHTQNFGAAGEESLTESSLTAPCLIQGTVPTSPDGSPPRAPFFRKLGRACRLMPTGAR